MTNFTWTRKMPTSNGRWWCAQRHGTELQYRLKLVKVFGFDSKVTVPHGAPFWGGAIPLSVMKRYDLWWAPAPIEEPALPPLTPERSTRRPL